MGEPHDEPAADQAEPALSLALELTGSLQRPEVVRRILERAVGTLDADRATLSSLTEESVIIEAVAGRVEGLTWVGQAYPMESVRQQPAVWEALTDRRIVLTGGLDAPAARPEFRAALQAGHHVAILPLLYEGDTIGLLVVTRFQDQPFGAADRAAMSLIAGVAAVALRNAALHRRLQQTAEALEATVAAARDLAAKTEFTDVAAGLLEHAVAAAHADGGSLMRVEGRDAVVLASTGGQSSGARYPVAAATLRALDTAEPAELTAAAYTDEHPEGAAVVAAFTRFLIVPLLVAGEAVGVLALGRRADISFGDAEVAGVRQIGSLAALLVRNAQSLAEAREANDARWTFFNLAVHELRAPITILRGYSAMLSEQGDSLPPAARAMVPPLSAAAARLDTVIDELLLAARLDTRRLGVSAREVDVLAGVEQAIERGRPAAFLRGGSVEARGLPGAALAWADPGLVSRVLDNLIGNAVKYAESAPHVEVEVTVIDEWIEVRVIDDGPGIPEALRGELFGMFVRGRPDRPGSGLGLYLSRGVTELMGGRLSLEDSPGRQGSVFLLQLPRR